VIGLFRKTFAVALWFSMCEQNDVTKCFPSDYISSCDTVLKKMLSHCLQDVMPLLTFCEFLLGTLNETDEPAASK
jgi:hypothetical protein